MKCFQGGLVGICCPFELFLLKAFKQLAVILLSFSFFTSVATLSFADKKDDLSSRWNIEDTQSSHFKEVQKLYLALSEKLRELQASIDPAQLDDLIDKNKIFVEIENVGKAEVTKIDHIPVIRIVHWPTQDALIYLPEELQGISKHLKKYLAKQHFDAGSTRTDGQQGRDVVLIRADAQGNLLEVKYSPRPEAIGKWLTEWKQATYVAPKSGDGVLGFACGIVQGGLALCISAANVHYGHEANIDPSPVIVSFTFGVMLGTFSGTVRNILQRGSTWWRTVKGALLTSATFAYSLKMMKDGARSVSPLEIQGLITNARIWLNILGNNYAKTFWYQLAITRKDMRSSVQDWTFSFPGLEKHIVLKREDVEFQLAYLGPFTLKVIDFLTNSKIPWISQLPIIGPVFTWSLGALVGSGMIMQAVTTWHANRVGYARAQRMAHDFERQNPLGWLWRIGKSIRNGGSWVMKKIRPQASAGCEVGLDSDLKPPLALPPHSDDEPDPPL